MFRRTLKRFSGRRPRVDPHALERLLASPPQDDEVGTPFRSALPIPPEATEMVSHLLFMAVVAITGGFVLRVLVFDTLTASLLIAAVIVTTAALVIRGGLNFARRIEVSDAGITVSRVSGEETYYWWDVRHIRATGDLSHVIVATDQRQARITLAPLGEDRRVAVLNAMRARLGPDRDVEPIGKHRLSKQTLGSLLHVVGSVLLFGTFALSAFAAQARTLGVRCSGPSAYLSRRFDVPRRPGCVFLRVSGPTARAGIHQGDEMIALDGTPVTSGPQFDGLFTAHTGSTFTFTIVRAHTHVTNTVRVSFGRASAIVAPKNDAITYFLNGKTDGANGRFSDAVADSSKAIQLAPDFDLAYIGRGAARSAIETSVETNNDFIKATELDPEQAEGLRDIVTGVPIPLTDEPGGVIDTIKRAIKSDECTALAGTQNSDCGRDYALLVFADYLAGKYDDGIATAPTAESFAIGDTVTYHYLAYIYIQRRDATGAAQALELFRRYAHAPADRDDAESIQASIDDILKCGKSPCDPTSAATTAAGRP